MNRLEEMLWDRLGRAGAVVAALVVLWVVAMLAVVLGAGSGGADVLVRRAATSADAGDDWLAGIEVGPAIEATATPEPVVSSIEELVANYGYPAGYDYGWLRIPKIGVDAPVGLSIVDGDQMGVPGDPATVFWYDFRGWDGYGGAPGTGENAVFSGHVDLSTYIPYAGVNYHGQGVFSNLRLLVPGDVIVVEVNGQTLEYTVAWVEQVGAADGDRWGEVLSSDVGTDSITLYTCGGEFDSVSRSYADRVVVRAERT